MHGRSASVDSPRRYSKLFDRLANVMPNAIDDQPWMVVVAASVVLVVDAANITAGYCIG